MNKHFERAYLATRAIDWVFLEIRDIDSQIEQTVRVVSSIADHYGADYRMFGSLILITLGDSADRVALGGRPQELIGALSRSFRTQAKILYGSSIGHSGFLGRTPIYHALLTPQLTEARHRVGSLDWGQVVKFSSEDLG